MFLIKKCNPSFENSFALYRLNTYKVCGASWIIFQFRTAQLPQIKIYQLFQLLKKGVFKSFSYIFADSTMGMKSSESYLHG